MKRSPKKRAVAKSGTIIHLALPDDVIKMIRANSLDVQDLVSAYRAFAQQWQQFAEKSQRLIQETKHERRMLAGALRKIGIQPFWYADEWAAHEAKTRAEEEALKELRP